MENEQKTKPSCGTCRGFNFCFWAKLLVAIPALPMIAYIAASFFTEPYWQMLAGAAAIGAAISLAVVVDRLPLLQRKFVSRRCNK